MDLQSFTSKIQDVERLCLAELEQVKSLSSLVDLENKYISKKGQLSEILKVLKDVAPSDRPKFGSLANQTKSKLELKFSELRATLEKEILKEKLQSEKIDFTLPGTPGSPIGSVHPISQVTREIITIFRRIGFDLSEGPEVETEFYNFDALNIPDDHPARDMQDTFYLPKEVREKVVLRTQTSPVQIRTMLEKKAPPIRILSPGAVFRSDYDVTHSPMFHQVEGLYVAKQVSFAELKGCLEFFAREMFGATTKIRLRPSYFPFVEPGAEVDVTCVLCKGSGCRVCKETGWLEILGSGMVHPKVFAASGLNPTEVQGFAFGMGVERIAMLKFGIPDLRLLFENDIRFLRQFGA